MELKDRQKAEYKNNSSVFTIAAEEAGQDCFRKQFFFLYRARLNAMTDRILASARERLGDNLQLTQLADVSGSSGDAFVVGVVLKKMKFRRSVLNDFAEEETLDFEYRAKMHSASLVSDEDVLEFESDQQIVKLHGNIDKDRFVTGNVLGLYGHITEGDFFHVCDIIYPQLAPQIPWPVVERNCFIAFISGISMSSDMTSNVATAYGLDKLASWLCGEVPLSDEEAEVVRNITRLVIAGDSIRITKKDDNDQRIEILGSDHTVDKNSIGQFDKLLSRFVTTIPVDLMSGPNDPTTLLMPQQPIPRVVFPWARRFGKLLNTVTNPYKFTVNGVSFLGTSGQNIRDLLRLTAGQPPLELMEECLRRGHIFPTIPDSIDGFPFQNRDPCVVEEAPHVFFAGNQAHLEQRWTDEATTPEKQRTLLLSVPAFNRQQTLALLNLRNMRVTEYDFAQTPAFDIM